VRRWPARIAIVATCVPLVWCVQSRRLVTLPAAEITVVDAAGQPLAGAAVRIHWWSYPHARLEQTHRFTAGADGRVVTTEQARRESVAPLCMHGVPEHHYTVCAGAPDHGWRAVEIDATPTAPVRLQLTGGAYADECDDHDTARFGTR
jgi:hypothetical protein